MIIIIIVFYLHLKKKITDQTNDDGTKDVDIMAPLKYLLNFLGNSENTANYLWN